MNKQEFEQFIQEQLSTYGSYEKIATVFERGKKLVKGENDTEVEDYLYDEIHYYRYMKSYRLKRIDEELMVMIGKPSSVELAVRKLKRRYTQASIETPYKLGATGYKRFLKRNGLNTDEKKHQYFVSQLYKYLGKYEEYRQSLIE